MSNDLKEYLVNTNRPKNNTDILIRFKLKRGKSVLVTQGYFRDITTTGAYVTSKLRSFTFYNYEGTILHETLFSDNMFCTTTSSKYEILSWTYL